MSNAIAAMAVAAIPWIWVWFLEYRDQVTYLFGHLAYINGTGRHEKPAAADYEWYRGWDDAQAGRNRYAAQRSPHESAIAMVCLIGWARGR
jgi:hypothetical protein